MREANRFLAVRSPPPQTIGKFLWPFRTHFLSVEWVSRRQVIVRFAVFSNGEELPASVTQQLVQTDLHFKGWLSVPGTASTAIYVPLETA